MTLRLKEIRKGAGVTQAQLAELLEVSQSTICSWETGAAQVPSATLPVLADLFGCTIDALFGREPTRDSA